ncbi:MAG: acyloxyacyl hydrolase [Alphaproteobacteria bacterium]|nr:acyloxyacyl hydrolase [Alphaproteobacteria bacterium]
MKSRLAGLWTALTLLLPLPAVAESSWLYEVRGGVLAHDVPIVAAGKWESGVSLNGEIAFTPSLALFGGAIRPAIGGTFTPNGQTSWAYADLRWEWAGSLFFFGIGVGPSIHTGDELYYSSNGHKGLGSRVLFHIPLEVGLQVTPNNRVAVFYEHVSNAFLAYPNPGMDNVGLRLAHRF